MAQFPGRTGVLKLARYEGAIGYKILSKVHVLVLQCNV